MATPFLLDLVVLGVKRGLGVGRGGGGGEEGGGVCQLGDVRPARDNTV